MTTKLVCFILLHHLKLAGLACCSCHLCGRSPKRGGCIGMHYWKRCRCGTTRVGNAVCHLLSVHGSFACCPCPATHPRAWLCDCYDYSILCPCTCQLFCLLAAGPTNQLASFAHQWQTQQCFQREVEVCTLVADAKLELCTHWRREVSLS